MPLVKNNMASPRGLTFMRPTEEGVVVSAAHIERVIIAPGESVEVDEKFLKSEGAKAMIESGQISVGTAKASEPDPESKGGGSKSSSKKRSKGGE